MSWATFSSWSMPLALLRLLRSMADEVRDPNGRGRVAGQVVEEAPVVEAVRPLAPPGSEVQHADELSLRHERHDDVDPRLADRVEGGGLEVEILHRDGAGVLLQVEEERVVQAPRRRARRR